MNLSYKQKIYLKYIGTSLAFLWSVGIVQIGFVYGRFEIQMLIIPGIVGVTLGYLLAKQRILKDANAESKRRFKSVVEMADEIATLQTIEGKYLFVSQAVKTVIGYDQQEFYASDFLFTDLILPEDIKAWEEYQRYVLEDLDPEKAKYEQGIVIRLRHKDGPIVWLRYRAKLIVENGQKVNISSVSINITETVAHEKRLLELADTDQLTQLPNRNALKKSAEKFLNNNEPFTMVMLDLNRFKSINDSLGHSVGDELLKLVSNRLVSKMDPSVSVYRFGGDEFVLLISGPIPVDQKLNQIRETVNGQYSVNHLELNITGSFGYVCYPEDATDFETLVRFSDAAMYQSKHAEIDCTRYTGQTAEQHKIDMYIERNIDQAIRNKAIFPYFQPIYAADTRQLIGVECLARWHTEELGWISPEDFITTAESAGNIQALGHSILEQSLEVYQKINQHNTDPISFSVNVSSMQLLDDRFVDDVLELLSKHQIKPGTLKFEVTESIFLGQKEMAVKSLKQLRKNGIKISLDDFGTGYSALSILKDFHIDQLKLDRSFMDDFQENKKAQSLVKYTIQVAHDMGMEVVAEGIEQNSQLSYLQSLNCDMYQGYLLSHPLSREDLLDLCAKTEA